MVSKANPFHRAFLGISDVRKRAFALPRSERHKKYFSTRRYAYLLVHTLKPLLGHVPNSRSVSYIGPVLSCSKRVLEVRLVPDQKFAGQQGSFQRAQMVPSSRQLKGFPIWGMGPTFAPPGYGPHFACPCLSTSGSGVGQERSYGMSPFSVSPNQLGQTHNTLRASRGPKCPGHCRLTCAIAAFCSFAVAGVRVAGHTMQPAGVPHEQSIHLATRDQASWIFRRQPIATPCVTHLGSQKSLSSGKTTSRTKRRHPIQRKVVHSAPTWNSAYPVSGKSDQIALSSGPARFLATCVTSESCDLEQWGIARLPV